MPIYTGPALREDHTLDQVLQRGLSADPDAVAVVCGASTLTWRELDESSSRLAGSYRGMGLQPGARVASLMPNSEWLVLHYFACLKAGLVPTPLNYRYVPSEIDHAVTTSHAALLVCHQERIADVVSDIRKVVVGAPEESAPEESAPSENSGVSRLEDLARVGEPLVQTESHTGDQLAFLYFTSGSTGKPKAVVHTRGTFQKMVCSTIQALQLTPEDTFLPGTSLSHIGGSLFAIASLMAGAKVVVSRSANGPEVLPLLRQHRPTVLWMLPVALIHLVRDADVTSQDFASIRLCFSGGDRVSNELEREFTEVAGFPIHESYGMTEIGMAAINPPDESDRIGSVGRLCPGMLAELRDERGQQVPPGTPGRLWIQSPTEMIGYWQNEQATSEVLSGDWLDTGDVMKMDAHGYLWFCGRKKQIIVHDGSNICPQEVEEALAEHPAVDEVGVVGVHDRVHGENVCAYVKIRAGGQQPTAVELIEFARQRVGYKAPEQVIFVDAMPLNSAGKIDRGTLRSAVSLTTASTLASIPSVNC